MFNRYLAGNRRGYFSQNPARTICLSFLLIITVGTLLLMMPFSSRTGQFTPPVDALFTATSATCVTGLVVYDTWTHWSPLGQGIIIALIQTGGLGVTALPLDVHRQVGAHRRRGSNEHSGLHLPREGGEQLQKQHRQQGD